MLRTAVVAAFMQVACAAQGDFYTPTPAGPVLSHCVHEIPEGSRIRELVSGDTLVTHPNGEEHIIAKCDPKGIGPVRLPQGDPNPLPPDYNGWLQYTAVNVSRVGASGGFDAFTNVMSVPDVPERPAQVLYLFPGLQNIDWIPKVDPEPTRENPFDIIQPVLQYPSNSFFHRGWYLKSWYVTVNAGALYSTGFPVESGDAVFCNMTRTGPEDWVIIGTSQKSGKSTTQAASNSRLKLQPWAYNTLECYGCNGCDTYPKNPVTFTANKLYQGGKQVAVPGSDWAINPKPAKDLQCKERTTVAADNGDTTIYFQ